MTKLVELIIDPLFFAELVLMGTVTGFLAGLLGIGGGMIQVPFLTAMLAQHGVAGELSIKMAIATAMATIVFTRWPACVRTTRAERCAGTSCGRCRPASSSAASSRAPACSR